MIGLETADSSALLLGSYPADPFPVESVQSDQERNHLAGSSSQCAFVYSTDPYWITFMNRWDLPVIQVPVPHQGAILPVPRPPLSSGGMVAPAGASLCIAIAVYTIGSCIAFRGYPDIQPVNKGVSRL